MAQTMNGGVAHDAFLGLDSFFVVGWAEPFLNRHARQEPFHARLHNIAEARRPDMTCRRGLGP